jgi:hypothetical protein
MKSQFNVDTVLKDVSILNKIEEYVTLLDLKDTLNQSNDCDIRIQCILNYGNKTSRRLCIGCFNCFMLDGKYVGESDSLAYLIKSHIGYYNFFDKESLNYTKEIKLFGIPTDYKLINRSFLPPPPNN